MPAARGRAKVRSDSAKISKQLTNPSAKRLSLSLDNLASALREHTIATTASGLTREQKITELVKIFDIEAKVKSITPLSDYISGGPGAVAAWFPMINAWDTFKRRGLKVDVALGNAAANFGKLADAIK
ncbi:hypothetical protein [Mesorhizobium sp. B2-3-5]|uniref:hypothetical protein n=1 Tax=Mesorhizobium sp. B2-3-5 TaxID=2589958 RepID=UPI00112A0335|nr:hypothetical protein [Mesorhizobium sp. B2-3-5]TPM13491.1 hypothetical protein FJ958_30970 [Mesorhizobium sp. B2-3-5]